VQDGLLITCGAGIGGFIIGMVALLLLLKYRVALPNRHEDYLVLELPLFGRIRTTCQIRYAGIFVAEWEEFSAKVARLGQLVPPEVMYRYAREYGITYIGVEGDRVDWSWSRGRLASVTRGCGGEYHLCLNPTLDTDEVARRLSQELDEVIDPSEVHLFLFLHEIGHTRKAGNQCYFTALINHALSGGRRSLRKRRELRRLKRQIEHFADQFALQELKKWRYQENHSMAMHASS
jgi:hypothetical protein